MISCATYSSELEVLFSFYFAVLGTKEKVLKKK
jgi:hypothetical protein